MHCRIHGIICLFRGYDYNMKNRVYLKVHPEEKKLLHTENIMRYACFEIFDTLMFIIT